MRENVVFPPFTPALDDRRQPSLPFRPSSPRISASPHNLLRRRRTYYYCAVVYVYMCTYRRRVYNTGGRG